MDRGPQPNGCGNCAPPQVATIRPTAHCPRDYFFFFGRLLRFVAPFAARLLRIDLPAALRTAAALELHDVVGAGTHSHDNSPSCVNTVSR